MSIDLVAYLSQRYRQEQERKETIGPFITLSRETGCNASGLARTLVREFRKRGENWHFVNKEVMEQAARKLQLDQTKLEFKLELEHKTHLDEIVWAFGEKHYKNDKKIRDTISQVIKHYAYNGRIIVVGRAGVSILSGMENGLHVRLEAPFEWRVKALAKRRLISEEEAAEYIVETDKKRKALLEQFAGKPFADIYFDLRINCETFSQKQQIELIEKAMEMKGVG